MTSSSSDQIFETIEGWQVLRLEEVDSTNLFLMREQEHLKHSGRVVLAGNQTKGRGRLGRSYVSLPGKHLTFSAVIHPGLPLAKIQGMALLAGIAVARVLETRSEGVRLKWPNDVLIRGQKVCGILVETREIEGGRYPVLILGIGLNTNGRSDEFPEDLQGKLTTLEEECGPKVNREEIFRELLQKLREILNEYRQEGMPPLLQEWLQRAGVQGERVCCLNGKRLTGTFESLSAEGFPVIRLDDGTRHVHLSGDLIPAEEKIL